jgi:hypothetical protein
MDGGALLDSLADWTAESHPNISPEARQHNNELMAGFRNELFNLLGSTTQVGGGHGNCLGGISIVQPMDEALIRELSPAELAYRLDLAEFGGQSGGADVIEEAGKKVGFLKRLKIWSGIRNFNKFVDDFEKLRAKINTNMSAYEIQLAQSKHLTDSLIESIKNIFLYSKVEVMWDILKKEDIATKGADEAIKFDVLSRRIDKVKIAIEGYKIEAEKNNKTAVAAFERKGGWFSKDTNIVNIMKKEVEKQSKAYMKLDAEMNYYVAEITKAKNLKLLEATVAGKNVKELDKAQRRELAEYQKNRAKYEKMFGFDEVKKQEYETMMAKKETLLIELDFVNRTLAAGKYMTGSKNSKAAMEKALKDWKTSIDSLYQDLNKAIAESGAFSSDLKKLSGLIADNTNSVGKLIAGNPDFEVIRKEYEKYLEFAEKAQEYQEGINSGLCSIKNKILELIPDKVLLQDMWIVSSAQGFVLRLVSQTMKDRQTTFGKNYNKGMVYFADKIKQMKGGSQQDGGAFLTLAGAIPPHGLAFYDHDDSGQVFNQATGNYVDGAAALNPTQVQILTLPYGARRITDEYVDKLNTAIQQVNDDEIIYIPLWDYNHPHLVFILTAQKTDDSSFMRVITAQQKTVVRGDFPGYQPITRNYYYYYPFSNVPAVDASIITMITRNNNLNIGGTNYILLPVFYKFTPQVNNILFTYDEYCLLNPLMSGVMSATFKETDLTRNPPYNPAAVPATTKGYAITEGNGTAGGTNLSLKFRLHTDDTSEAELKGTGVNQYDYYYNFSGPDITVKAPTAGRLFTTTNHGLGLGIGNLQPTANIDLKTIQINSAVFGNYMFQITGHINLIAKEIFTTQLNTNNVPPTITGISQINSGNPIAPTNDTFNILYEKTHGPTQVLLQNADRTILDMFTSKTWDNTYNEAVFGCSGDDFMFLLLPLKTLLFDIVFWARQTTRPDRRILAATADPNNPLTKKLLSVVAAGAGISLSGLLPTAPGTVAGATGTGAAATGVGPAPGLTDKQKDIYNFLKIALPQSGNAGSYWANLEEMDKIIAKFSSQAFTDYNTRLFKIYDTMTDIKKFEDNVLDIKPEKDKLVIPEVNLIAKTLAVKPPENSKDAYTEAGTKLYDKLKQDKLYIAQNTFKINTDNLLNVFEPILYKLAHQAGQGSNVLSYIATMTEIFSPPYVDYKVYLSTKEGAEKLRNELENSKYNSYKDRIMGGLYLLLHIDQSDTGHLIYQQSYTNFIAGLNQKKKGNKKKKPGQTNKPKNPPTN